MHENIVKMQVLCNRWWFKIIQTKTHPKNFAKTSTILKKSQKFSKTSKVRSKDMKCMINERENIILEKKNDLKAEDLLGMRFRVKERWLGRRGDVFCRERSRRNEENIAQTLFIGTPVSRWIERYWDLLRLKTREIAIKQLSRICWEVSTTKGAWWIEKLSSIQKVPRWIE